MEKYLTHKNEEINTINIGMIQTLSYNYPI